MRSRQQQRLPSVLWLGCLAEVVSVCGSQMMGEGSATQGTDPARRWATKRVPWPSKFKKQHSTPPTWKFVKYSSILKSEKC